MSLSEVGPYELLLRCADKETFLAKLRLLVPEELFAEKDKQIATYALTIQDANQEIVRLREACYKEDNEIEQILGKALGYPWYKDDQKTFPGATEADGVCVGAHVPATLAAEAATRIEKLETEIGMLKMGFKFLSTKGGDSVRG